MKIKKELEKEYEDFIDRNRKDSYSIGTVDYMIRWADLMEECINSGETIKECREKTSREADINDITKHMYEYAKSALIVFWEYGNQLEDKY